MESILFRIGRVAAVLCNPTSASGGNFPSRRSVPLGLLAHCTTPRGPIHRAAGPFMYHSLSHRRKISNESLAEESKLHHSRSRRAMLRTWVQALLAFVVILLLSSLFSSWRYWNARDSSMADTRIVAEVATVPFGPVMVSYSYFEKDPGQLSNAEFFIAVGMGISSTFKAPAATDFTVVISGDICSPCKALLPLVRDDEEASTLPQLIWGKSTDGLALLQRTENEGMDFAAHNVSSSCAM